MYRNIISVLIYLSMMLPIISLAAALNKYAVPQQESGFQLDRNERPGYVGEDVYKKFMDKIRDYSQEKKDKLVNHFRGQIKKAKKVENTEAVAYYQRLIGILSTNKRR